MKKQANLFFLSGPSFFRTPLFVTVIVICVYSLYFLVGNFTQSSKILLYEYDEYGRNSFWNLPAEINFPWRINPFFHIPIIFILICMLIISIRFYLRIRQEWRKTNFRVLFSSFYFFTMFFTLMPIWVQINYSPYYYEVVYSIILWGSVFGFCCSVLLGVSLALFSGFEEQLWLRRREICYLKLFVSIMLFSIFGILLVIMANFGIENLLSSLLIDCFAVTLAINFGMAFGVILKLIFQYIASLPTTTMLWRWLNGEPLNERAKP